MVDSDDSSEHDDPFAVLGVPYTKSSRSSANFTDLPGLTKSVLEPPSFKRPKFSMLDESRVDAWKKSKVLTELHQQDDREAMVIVREQEQFRQDLKQALDKDAYEDERYVDYITNHKDDPSLKDFFYLSRPQNVDVSPSPPFTVFALDFGVKWLTHDQVMDQPHVCVVERAMEVTSGEPEMDLELVKTYMLRLGVSPEMLSLEQLTNDHLQYDPKWKRQPIPLVIKKMEYMVRTIRLRSEYDEEFFVEMIKIIGFLMMDHRVLSSNVSTLVTSMINELLHWQFDSSEEIRLQLCVDTWLSLSDLIEYNYRILTTLTPHTSRVIQLLRKCMALSLLVSDFPELTTDTPQNEVDQVVYQSICGALTVFGQQSQQHTRDDYAQWIIKLRAVVICVNGAKPHVLLSKMGRIVSELEEKIPVSYNNESQSLCRSALLLLSAHLNAFREKPVNNLL